MLPIWEQHARGNFAVQVIQRVVMLGKNDDLALTARGIVHLGIVLKNFRQLIPLTVLS